MNPLLSHSLVQFSVKVCNELGKDKTTICSPLSAEIVMAMVALGCKNETHAELMKALDIPDDDTLRSSFAFLTSNLKTIKDATLGMANKIYLKKGSKLKQEVIKDAKEVFDSSLEQLDFNERQASAAVINKWGNWKLPFRKKATRDRTFYVNNTTPIMVPQMSARNQCFKCGVSSGLNAKLLQMDYRGDEASMIVILPVEVEGLNSVLQQLAAGHDLTAEIEALKETNNVNVIIPKFKAQMTIDFKELLPKLGIKTIFDEDKSDIHILTSREVLFVSEAIQKVFIMVDETGTEASARTLVVEELRVCARVNSFNFVADHPFLYLLTARKIPLFIGVYEGSAYARTTS